ncbi:MAG TPA: hydroxysqualene dehydroxylase HpnE [Mycobacteriales bacterium]|nr:hydroxysqualene dehydroxylase HpnE [Mycobacteriales bacterium]
MTGSAHPSGAPGGRPRARGHVVVVGGGLAGLAAAIRLADGGASVTLAEARPRLGGATHSFHRDGLVIDNGQHVFLRCYTAYQAFLRRIGTADRTAVQERFTVPVVTPGGRGGRLYRDTLPAPLHLGGSLARYRLLGPADRLRVIRAALRLRSLDPDDPTLDRHGFGWWLDRQGQTERCVRALWEPFTTSALNLPVAQASLALAAKVFRTGMLSATDAADIGFPLVPLEDLHARPAAALLRRLGCRVRVSAKVTAVAPVVGGFAVTVDGERIDADAVVLAVPHRAAARLLPPGALPGGSGFGELSAEPIVNLHVLYDRRVTGLGFAAAVGSPVQWVFDRGHVAGVPRAEGQYLAVSLSAAGRYVDTPTGRLREEFLPALERLFAPARDARVRTFFVTRERRATFRQAPGCRQLRPAAATAVPGLLLAGAWTGTGWPDVMEGAVRSGEEAARLAATHLRANSAGIPNEAEVTA